MSHSFKKRINRWQGLLKATEFKLEFVLLHTVLILLPLSVQWALIHTSWLYRQQMKQTAPPPVLKTSIYSKHPSLAEILSQPTPTPEQFDTMFAAYAAYYRVDEGLLRSLAYCESRYIPTATNGRHAGLYQFNPGTWQATRKRMGLDPDVNLRFDAEESIKTAAFKLANSGSGAWVVCSQLYYGRS